MKHSGKAFQAGLKLIGTGLLILLALLAAGYIGHVLYTIIHYFVWFLVALWVLFAAFCLYFFRDPDPVVPTDPGVALSPGHGVVDVVEEYNEMEFMGGPCLRISVFLSPVDVHVQKAILAGRVEIVKHKDGQYGAAMKSDCGLHNENVLIGFTSSEGLGEKAGVRLIAGFLARRIIPWVKPGDTVERGERISLIQFGSRCDIYLPKSYKATVQLGDRVKGGETIIARK